MLAYTEELLAQQEAGLQGDLKSIEKKQGIAVRVAVACSL